MELLAGGALLRLLPERAAYLPEHHTLLVADAHIGKAQAFRRLGVPVPGGTTAATLQRLSRAVATTGARHIVFLRDLLHNFLKTSGNIAHVRHLLSIVSADFSSDYILAEAICFFK